jgi:hypothetical protein
MTTNEYLRITVKREARAERMASAIEAALPLIDDMWNQFPYATKNKDDETMTELREAVKAFRRLQVEERAYFGI